MLTFINKMFKIVKTTQDWAKSWAKTTIDWTKVEENKYNFHYFSSCKWKNHSNPQTLFNVNIVTLHWSSFAHNHESAGFLGFTISRKLNFHVLRSTDTGFLGFTITQKLKFSCFSIKRHRIFGFHDKSKVEFSCFAINRIMIFGFHDKHKSWIFMFLD